MAHPSVVRGGEGEVLPVHGSGIAKGMIDDTESGLQI